MPPDRDALSGAQLEQLLDRLEADLEESDSSEAADLLARLRAKPLRADTLDAVDRLHTLWMRAGDTPAARAVVDGDGAAVLAAAPADAQTGVQMQLALYRLQMASYLRDEAAALQALAEMHTIVRERPDLDADAYRQLRVFDQLEYAAFAVALPTIDLREAIDQAIPGRAAFRAWDTADHHRRRAWAYSRHEQLAEARAAAEASIAALQTAAPDQDVDENDWLRLGDALIEIVPDHLAAFAQPVTALTADWSLPRRRGAEVRLARLGARAKRKQGDLAGALQACAAARYSLSSDGSDDFIEYELEWLIEAGRFDEAGQRAFFHIYQVETGMWEGLPPIVSARLADPADTSVWWALCALRACHLDETFERFVQLAQGHGPSLHERSDVHRVLFAALDGKDAEEALPEVVVAAHALAEARAPKHPWTTRLMAVRNGMAGRIDPTTEAAQLLAATHETEMEDNRTAYSLFHARARSLGLLETLRLPVPAVPSGLWGYAFAVTVDNEYEEQLDDLPAKQQDEAQKLYRKLLCTVYEQAQARMERYFATGTGHPYDACAHLYSMLCNNLAIQYRYYESRYDDAVELHRRGIAASPFAEHYDGILRSRIEQEDHAGVLDAAEALWNFSADYGYSRHEPNDYVGDVAHALLTLGRPHEMSIWLERLAHWQQENGESEDALTSGALGARLRVLLYMGQALAEETTTYWNRLEPQVRFCDDYWALAKAAQVMGALERFDEAAALCQRSMDCNPRDNASASQDYDAMKTLLASYQRGGAGAASGKSWWQFWK